MSTQRPSQRTHAARTPQSESFRKRAFLATALALMVAPMGFAQTAAPAVSAADLAKYDANRDGVLDVAETATMDAAAKKDGATKIVKTGGEETIELSPFIVSEENNQGYEATNTMSGSRLNTKLEDVGASISVVTKAQLLDFAATDINDIFAMEAGTEGTRTYTANTNDGKGDVDNVANSPQTSNRVRGLGSANLAMGNFGMSTSIPLDTYNVDGVEISRGANSSIFGVGEGSGTVNLIPSSANIFKDKSAFSIAASSYGTKRGTIDLNRVLLKGVFGIRVLGLMEDKGFVRKPSSDKTRRITFGVQYKPFKNTTIRASYETFDERYSRPNSVTAKDYLSLWEAAGKPIYDQSIALAANRAVLTGTNTTAYTPLQYMYVSSNLVRPTMWIDQGKVQHFTASTWYVPTTYTAGIPSAWSTYLLPYFELPTGYNVPFAYQGNSVTGQGIGYDGVPASTDRSFYDYTSVNLAGLNYGTKRANFGRAEVEQFFLNTKHHMLALQLGAFQERISDVSHNYVGNGGDGIAATVRPDINKYLPNGTLNPYFGAPYIAAVGPQIYVNPVNNVTAKANLAYQADFSRDTGWTKWFGRQRLLGYKEYNRKEWAQKSLRYHDQIDPHTASSLGLVAANNKTAPNYSFQGSISGSAKDLGTSNAATPQMRYYLGDTQGNNIDYASQRPDYGDSLTYYRYGSSVASPYSYGWSPETVTMASPYFSQGMTQTQLRTKGYVYQGWFLKDRIIPLYGERSDSQRTRNNIGETTGSRDEFNWLVDESYLSTFTGAPWLVANKATGSTINSGKTRTKGIIVKPFNWLSLRYNESSSFKPDNYAIDYAGNPMRNPFGTTKDYGFGLSFFDNRLNVRLTRYESLTIDARTPSINTVANRITNLDFDVDPISNSVKMDAEDFLTGEYAKMDGVADASTGTVEQQAKWLAQAHANMGLSSQLIADLRKYDRAMTSDAVSKGYELELTYNPTRFWTMKLTGSQTEAINKNLSRTWIDYKNARLEYWKNLKSPYLTPATVNLDGTITPAYYIPFWTTSFATNSMPRDYFTGTVDAPMKLNYALEGKPVPQNRKYKFNYMTSYKLAGLFDNKHLRNASVGGRLSWEDRGAIGFGAAAPDADGVIRAYDADTIYWDKSHTYCDLFAGYDLKLFRDKVRAKVQLNVRNVFENGRLQAFSVRPDGVPTRFRIVDPREFVLTVSFDL